MIDKHTRIALKKKNLVGRRMGQIFVGAKVHRLVELLQDGRALLAPFVGDDGVRVPVAEHHGRLRVARNFLEWIHCNKSISIPNG